jgi:hypothetical protein
MTHLHTTPERSRPSILSADPGTRCLPEALTALRHAQVSLVRFEYSGQGGVRRSKPTTYHDETGRAFSVGVPKTVRQDIDIFFHELLDLRFPAWAYAEGSRGEFEWNIVADDLEHRHCLREITYETVTVQAFAPSVV